MLRTSAFLALLSLAACQGSAHTQAREAPAPASSETSRTEEGGPPDAMVRADLDCPEGEVDWVGGLGSGGRVIVRTLTACGVSATYVRDDEDVWALQVE